MNGRVVTIASATRNGSEAPEPGHELAIETAYISPPVTPPGWRVLDADAFSFVVEWQISPAMAGAH
jgi:hypothetical protein